MPTLYLTVPETHTPISRAVTYSIIEELVSRTQLDKNTPVLFPGQHSIASESGSRLGDTNADSGFGHNAKLQIEVSEEYLEDAVPTTAIHRPDYPVLFNDGHLGINIRPIYVSTEVSISITHRTTDKVSAERWRDQMRLKLSQGREAQLHSINYHFAIPHPILHLLYQFHKLRENVAGYGDTLKQWMQPRMTQRATTLVTQAGTQPELVIAEQQVGVQGWFDFNNAPQAAQIDGEGAAQVISVEYRFRYDKVVGCVLEYPLMIHNQLIPSKYRPVTKVERVEDHHRTPSLSGHNFARLDENQMQAGTMLEGVAIPHFDEWYPKHRPANIASLLRLMLSVDDNGHDIVNLGNLGRYAIDGKILAFLREEVSFLTTPYESPFLLTLYKRDAYLDTDAIVVDAELNVTAVTSMDPRERYHLQLGLVKDLNNLSPPAKDRLTRNPEIVETIINVLYPGLIDTTKPVKDTDHPPGYPDTPRPGGITPPRYPGHVPDGLPGPTYPPGGYYPTNPDGSNGGGGTPGLITLPSYGGGKYVPKKELDKIFDIVDKEHKGGGGYNSLRHLTVGVFSIIAKKGTH